MTPHSHALSACCCFLSGTWGPLCRFRCEKSRDNDRSCKAYINDGKKKIQLLLLFQVFIALLHKQKCMQKKYFFITLPLIQCKCHCTYVAYTAKARSQKYCSHIPDGFTVSLALLRITTPHPVLFHMFQKIQGYLLQWSINLKHK